MWVGELVDPLAMAIWKNFAPNKCRIFLWLANKNRLFTNERRFRRGIATSPACPLCPGTESVNHLLLHCPELTTLWRELSSLTPDIPADLSDLWANDMQNKIRSTIMLAILWNIWKRRNAKVFRDDTQPVHLIARSAADDVLLWSSRCTNEQAQGLLREWGTMLFHLSMRL